MSVFEGCVMTITGHFHMSAFELAKLVTKFGGRVSFMITPQVTHLVTTAEEVESNSSKVKAARRNRCPIVREEYVAACIHAGRRLEEARFLLAPIEEPVAAQRRDIARSKDSMRSTGEVSFTSTSTSIPQAQAALPAAWKHREVRIFVSSTFRDMAAERRALVLSAFERIKALCVERNVLFGFVDLRWGITAEETLGGRALLTCLKEVDLCRPYFVCMLGERYGWVANGAADDAFNKNVQVAAESFPWVDQYRDRSITEMEILHGALMIPEAQAHRAYFYLRDPAFIEKVPAAKRAAFTEPARSESARKLKDLKEDIKRSQRNVRDGFRDAEELAQQVYADLALAIEEDFPVAQKSDQAQREDAVHEAFAASRARVYVKHTDIGYQMRNFIYSETESLTVVTGPRGVGKSALLANFWIDLLLEQERLGSLGDRTLVLAHFTSAGDDTASLKGFLRRVIRAVAAFFSLPAPASISDDELLSEFRAWLAVASARGNLILIVDGVELFDAVGVPPLHWLPAEIPRNVKVFASIDSSIIKEFTRKDGVVTVTLAPLTTEAKRAYVAEYLRVSGKKLSEAQTNAVVESKNTESPLYMRILLDDLRLFASFEDLDARIAALLAQRTVTDLYLHVIGGWRERFPTSSLVDRTLCFLLYSRRGLYESELQELLGQPDHFAWSSCFLAIRDALLNSGGLLSLGDPCLREAVTKLCGDQQAQTRRDLLAFFKHAPLARRLQEVPHQMQQLKEVAALRQFLLSLPEATAMAAQRDTRAELHAYWRALNVLGEDLATLYSERTAMFADPDPLKHAETLSALAGFLDEAGAYNAALRMHEEALASVRDKLEPAQLARYSYSVGCLQMKVASSEADYTRAETALREAWRLLEQQGTMGADAAAMLGLVHKKRAKYAEARKFYDAALRALPVGHAVKRAELLGALGDVERKLENYKVARESYEQSLELLMDAVGPQHGLVIEVHRDLGLVAKKMADYPTAMKHYEQGLAIAEKQLGPSHPQCCLLLKEVADVHRKLGHLDAAMETYNRVLAKVKEAYNENHPEVAEVLNNQGLVEKKRGNYAGAQALYERALKILTAAFQSSHPKVAMVNMNLADIYRKRGLYAKAKDVYVEAVGQLEASLGADHPEVAEVLNSLGLVCKKQALYADAEEAYDRALNIFKHSYGAAHPKVGIVLNNLADVKRKQRDLEAAARIYAEALRIVGASLGQESADAGEVLANMGLLARDQGDMSEATRLTQKALVIFERELGSDHYKVGMALHNLAQIATLRQETSTAEPLFERALRLLESTPPELVDVLFDYGALLNQKRQFDKAQEVYKRGLAVTEKIFGKDHPKVKAFQQQLVV